MIAGRATVPSGCFTRCDFLMIVLTIFAFIIWLWPMITICNDLDTYLDREQTHLLSPQLRAPDEVRVVQLAIASFRTEKKLTGGPTLGA